MCSKDRRNVQRKSEISIETALDTHIGAHPQSAAIICSGFPSVRKIAGHNSGSGVKHDFISFRRLQPCKIIVPGHRGKATWMQTAEMSVIKKISIQIITHEILRVMEYIGTHSKRSV